MSVPEADPASQRSASEPSVFISYARSDSTMARRIGSDLQARGVNVWIDELSLAVGDPWARQIRDAIRAVDAVLILISESSLESKWVQHEWSNALSANSVRLIPALIGPIDWGSLPPELSSIQFADLTKDYKRGINSIVEALSGLRISRAPDPASFIDMNRLVLDVTERVAEQLGIERQREAHRQADAEGFVDDTLAFVIISFAEEMEPVFDAISAAADKIGLRAERVKDVLGDYRITDQIMKMIQSARLVVADLSLERPNVYFELGYARGLGKSVVTIMRSGTKVHFDVKDWNYIAYTDSRPLERDLIKRFQYEIES